MSERAHQQSKHAGVLRQGQTQPEELQVLFQVQCGQSDLGNAHDNKQPAEFERAAQQLVQEDQQNSGRDPQ